VSFPVVVTNPVSTTTGSSPSTCSTVSTSSDGETPCEDESKEDGAFAARQVLDRVLRRWRAANAEKGKDTANVPRVSTPRPVLCAPPGSGTGGSDSDPWDVVPGGAL
jgi:hypothetical protein